jgi:hypothetical protein
MRHISALDVWAAPIEASFKLPACLVYPRRAHRGAKGESDMQLSYHSYYFADRATNELFRADIRPFLSGFAGWKNAAFKNGFHHAGESVFLLPEAGSVYLFVQARDKEIIKRIERSTMSVGEIREALGDTESVGFASYVYLQEDHLAIGSTVLAPRMSAFGQYVNELLQKLDIGLKFCTGAITHTLPKADVQRLTHVGSFSMKVQSKNRFYNSLVASLGGSDREDFDIGSIEITVRPVKQRGNTHRALVAAVQGVGDEGLVSFDARAKIDAADKMADIFIVGAGGIRDPIDTDNVASIVDQIVDAANSNAVLKERLNEIRQDSNLASVDDPADLDLYWPPARATALGSDKDDV